MDERDAHPIPAQAEWPDDRIGRSEVLLRETLDIVQRFALATDAVEQARRAGGRVKLTLAVAKLRGARDRALEHGQAIVALLEDA